MSPPSASRVRTAVAKLHPEAAVADVAAVEAGTNAVYAVSFADREAVLKVGTATPDRVRAEPAVVRFVGRRTAVPVPAVLGVADDTLEYPCCLFDRVPGRTVPDRPDGIDFDVLARLCEEAGGHLAAIHGIDEFDTVGPLAPADDGVTVADTGEDWPSLLERSMHDKIEELGTWFEGHRDAIRAYADGVGDRCRRLAPFDPVLVHMDYRPANLVFDPEGSPVTLAVLDWGGGAAAPAAYEVAHAEALLTEWPRLDADRRARLRECFRSGYGSVGETPDVPDVYRVDARLRLMKHLETEVRGRDVATETRVQEHVRSLASLRVL